MDRLKAIWSKLELLSCCRNTLEDDPGGGWSYLRRLFTVSVSKTLSLVKCTLDPNSKNKPEVWSWSVKWGAATNSCFQLFHRYQVKMCNTIPHSPRQNYFSVYLAVHNQNTVYYHQTDQSALRRIHYLPFKHHKWLRKYSNLKDNSERNPDSPHFMGFV